MSLKSKQKYYCVFERHNNVAVAEWIMIADFTSCKTWLDQNYEFKLIQKCVQNILKLLRSRSKQHYKMNYGLSDLFLADVPCDRRFDKYDKQHSTQHLLVKQGSIIISNQVQWGFMFSQQIFQKYSKSRF